MINLLLNSCVCQCVSLSLLSITRLLLNMKELLFYVLVVYRQEKQKDQVQVLYNYYFEFFLISYFIYTIGLFFVIPCTDSITKVDLRTITLDIPPQEVT